MPTVKNHTGLQNGIDMEDESKPPVGYRKCIFWQTSTNNQRLRLKVCINGFVIEGLINTGKCHYSRILESELASSRGRYSIPMNRNSISSETKHELG